MIQAIIFKLLDLWRVCRRRNWEVIENGSYTDGTEYTTYVYNGKVYTHIGDNFPPQNIPFSLPISKALMCNKDITQVVKRFIGPLGTDAPLSGYMFPKRKFKFFVSMRHWKLTFGFKQLYVKGHDHPIHVQNIIGHWSVLGARKN